MRTRHTLVLTVVTSITLLLGLTAPAGAESDDPIFFWAEDSSPGLSVNGSYVPIVGNFAGAGLTDDIFWYAPGPGLDQLWTSNNDASFHKSITDPQVNGTYTPLVGDFAGSAYEDILWYGPGGVADALWTSNGSGGFSSSPTTVNGTYAPFVLDDMAGKDDIVWTPAAGGAGSIWSFEGMGDHLSNPLTRPMGTVPLTGWFNGGACADVFWYGAGAAADSLVTLSCNGIVNGTYPQVVNGTFKPVVELFTWNNGDAYSDILWYRSPGTSVLWESDGDGTWTTSPHEIEAEGTPLAAADNWGVAHIYSPTGPDAIWWDKAGASDHSGPLANTDHGAGWFPLVGRFVGFEPDIFWYKPGASSERLFYAG